MTPETDPTGTTQQSRDKTSLYRVAHDQGLRTLEDQRDELNGVRTRAGQFMAFVGSATAFLVGTALSGDATRDTAFYWIAGAATAISGLSILSLLLVLSPRLVFNFRLSPQTLIDRWIDREVPGPNEGELLRALASRYDGMIEDNEATLTKVRLRYLSVVCTGATGLLGWVLLAWLRG